MKGMADFDLHYECGDPLRPISVEFIDDPRLGLKDDEVEIRVSMEAVRLGGMGFTRSNVADRFFTFQFGDQKHLDRYVLDLVYRLVCREAAHWLRRDGEPIIKKHERS